MITLEPATVTINGDTYTAELATVEYTHLGYEDHGVLIANVCFVWTGGGQCTPGNILSMFSKKRNLQEGTAFGLDHIMRIIDTFGVDAWEKIAGKRAYILKTERYGLIEGIMNADNPGKHIIFKHHAKEWYPE